MVAFGLNIDGNIATEVFDWETNERFCSRFVPLGKIKDKIKAKILTKNDQQITGQEEFVANYFPNVESVDQEKVLVCGGITNTEDTCYRVDFKTETLLGNL